MHISVRLDRHDRNHGQRDHWINGLHGDDTMSALIIALLYGAAGAFLMAKTKDQNPDKQFSKLGTFAVVLLWPVCVFRGVFQI
ncbi:hypothetical protein [Robbsia andropogonis]|uniref:hypothetical protein n=1 Tax=Robbsia andropogonis TaxID=28092 RepID=UPI0020A20725|nr:hypothetical protein [Robbsia andropogonis]MCP1117019.1 hypothetical protein [Robbsia andropogonis]MCP1126302.1 hypothetical protein [Robbsia andropogonis]